MKNGKLQTKDLILAGVFAVLYVALVSVLASLTGMVPVIYLLMPLIAGIILGPVYVLYLTKVPKKGAVIILAILAGLIMSAASAVVLVYVLILGIIAQVILTKTGYSKGGIRASYCIFACDTVGPFLTLYFARDVFMNACLQYYGQAWVDKLNSMTPTWFLLVQIAFGLIGGFIGGIIGVRMNAKHFEKAGIV